MERVLAAVVAAIVLTPTAMAVREPTSNADRQPSTPAPAVASCDALAVTGVESGSATPVMGAGGGMDQSGMAMGSPAAGLAVEAVEFDRLYIDMMIPHHASIIAMAEAALPRLTDERLREIAQAVVATQRPELRVLRELRGRLYGSAEPVPMAEMDGPRMEAMTGMMPGMGSMADMLFQMDPAAQIAAFCGAEDADLAFIDLTIPHHQMAIVASEAALTQAATPEVRDFARRVIAAQQREIETLTEIRAELVRVATPEPVAAAAGHDGAHVAAHPGAGPIRALPADVVAQIERGEGAGLALPAEANGVPGPRHALDLAAELGLSAEQRAEIRATFDAMKGRALPAGERYLAAQRALEADFRAGTLTPAELPRRVAEVSRREGELATIHLVAHLETAAILTPEQTAAYARRRGT